MTFTRYTARVRRFASFADAQAFAIENRTDNVTLHPRGHPDGMMFALAPTLSGKEYLAR